MKHRMVLRIAITAILLMTTVISIAIFAGFQDTKATSDLPESFGNLNIGKFDITSRQDNGYGGTGQYMSWGIEAMGLDHAIASVKQKSNPNRVLVAVIDTGVNTTLFRNYFPNKTLRLYCVEACPIGMVDHVGHGTFVIGTIAEGTPDNVELLMIRVSDGEEFSSRNLIDGINYAVEQGADIINISAGTFYDFDNDTYNAEYDMTWGEVYRLAWEMEKAAVDAALGAGAIIVSGSGNEGENIVDYPASHDGVIDVGAINEDLTIANLSNHTQYVDYAAPGANVRGLNTFYEEQGDITMISQGTSMAVPHIVAAVANLLSFNKNLTVDEVKEILNAWAIDLGVTGRDDYFGNGFVDFSDAQFCVDGMKCDNRYGVFAIGPDDSGEDEEPDVPVPDTDGSDEEPDIPVPDTDGSSSTDKDTSKSEGAATNIPVPNTGASTGESNAEKVAISIGAALLIIAIGLLTYVVNRQKSKVKF